MVLTIVLGLAAALVACAAGVPRRAPCRGGSGVENPLALAADPPPSRIRLATYNIHGAKGTDGVRDLGRIAGVIGRADVVALQEVRAGWRDNQAGRLGRRLECGWLFTPTLRRWFRDYRGNALLTRFPVGSWSTEPLPNLRGRRFRACTVCALPWRGATLSILFTHLHTREGRGEQLEMVIDRFLGLPPPAVLLGDLNTRRDDPRLGALLGADGVEDALTEVLGELDPPYRVDWIVTKGLRAADGGVAAEGASDHPYFWVEVERRLD